MSFQDMYQELLGLPQMNLGLAKRRINEAWGKVQQANVWSFQCKTGGWLTPNLLGGQSSQFVSPGTISVVPFTTTITGDAVATAAWTATVPFPPLLTQQQIRVPYFALYSIIALGNNGTVAYATNVTPGSGQTPGIYVIPVLDSSGPGAGATVSITVNPDGTVTEPPIVLTMGNSYLTPYINFAEGGVPATFLVTLIATLTIDRPWTEPLQSASNYVIYQAYYPAPPNWKRWFAITDYENNNAMDYWTFTQASLNQEDPQRTEFDQPEFVVPFSIDNRPGSATQGQMLMELWPHPLSEWSYTFQCQCDWPSLVSPNDTLPYPIRDELVKERAYEMLSLWQEAQKGTDVERGAGASWQFLTKAHHEEYMDLLRQARIMDRHLMELYYQKARMNAPYNGGEPFQNTTNQANVGW